MKNWLQTLHVELRESGVYAVWILLAVGGACFGLFKLLGYFLYYLVEGSHYAN